MWRPKERIKYHPSPGRWPAAEEASASRWFSPVQIGALELRRRTWVPAMVPWRATDDGAVTDNVLQWYRRFAEGRPGGLVVEATGIRDVPSGPLLRIGHDRFLPGLRDLVDTVRDASSGETKLFIQLIDFLSIKRRPDPAKFLNRFLSITAQHRKRLGAEEWPEADVRAHLQQMPEEVLRDVLTAREFEDLTKGFRERVTDVHLDHIKHLPEVLPGLFADAAVRAREAGFDGVELHYAHAYTMASFLSALNTRDDGYGGAREDRVRLPLKVFHSVRQAVGPHFAAGCRFLAEDCIDGGNQVEDTTFFGVEFARAGMDFLSLSRGGKFEDAKQPAIGQAVYPYTGPSGYECMPSHFSDAQGPFGRNIAPTARIRQRVREAGYDTPVIVTGGIHGFEQAEAILQNEDADLVGAARQSLADPDWFEKARLGCGSQVRSCEFTNYCEGLDQKHKQVTCKLWDRVALDAPDVPMASDGKRRLVAPRWQR